MRTPFQQWEANVKDHPHLFQMGNLRWKDTKTGWSCWVSNGIVSYNLASPDGGEISISLIEKWKMHRLINWWAVGSLALEKKGDK